MRREFVVKVMGAPVAGCCCRSTAVVALIGIGGSEIGVSRPGPRFFRTHARERYGRVWTLMRSEP